MRGVDDPIREEAEALERLEQVLLQSVRDQAMADVPVGAFLSGCIDSSTVVALYRQHSPGRTFNYTLLGLSRARVTLEEDPARMRPSDIPTVLGDRSRIAAEIGWQPEVPIERTLADLLDYWRKATPRPAAGRP